jgi:hypothetical protein
MSTPRIDSYRFGHIVIDGEAHSNDVIILPGRVIGDWWRREGHVLHTEDLDPVFEAAPSTLVVGQGANGRMRVPAQTRRALEDAGIEVVAADTDQAMEEYNRRRDGGNVAAALHLTC